jgi:hypothetical protein
MRKILSCFLIFLGSCAAPTNPHPAHPTPHAMQAESVIALDTTGPRPAVTLALNGAEYHAIFDTGATNTVVNIERAGALGLANEGPLAPPFDRAHASTGYQTTLRGASVGGYALPTLSVPVLPSPLPDVAAIISPNAFSGSLLSLDLEEGELRIQPKGAAAIPAGESYPYGAPPFALPTIPVVIGGQRIAAHLDTGSPVALIFPMTYASQFSLAEELEQIGVARSHFGQQPIYRGQIEGVIRVGPLELSNPEVRFTDAVPNANVGTALLRRLVIVLDPDEQRLWALQKGD